MVQKLRSKDAARTLAFLLILPYVTQKQRMPAYRTIHLAPANSMRFTEEKKCIHFLPCVHLLSRNSCTKLPSCPITKVAFACLISTTKGAA